MSLRSEIQELVEWISDVSEPPAEVADQAVYHENWARVGDSLSDATDKFKELVAALEAEASSFVDFARDLERQTEALELRARMLERRAPKKPLPTPAEQLEDVEKSLVEKRAKLKAIEDDLAEKRVQLNGVKAELKDVKAELDGVNRNLTEKRKELERLGRLAAPVEAEKVATTTAGTPKKPSEAAGLARSASGTLGTAHKHLLEGIEHPDGVAQAFEEELDLLAEMTLSLRQQLEVE